MKEILDIFSQRKKIKTVEKKPTILVDYRERKSLVVSEIIKKGININFKALKVADYIINDVAIERKTVSDFISSMINKRLLKQLEEIKQYPQHILIIEGIEEQELYNDDEEGINGNAIRGMILSIILRYKVPIIFTKNSEDTASFIKLLTKKPRKKEFSLNPKKRSLDVKEQKQFIIESFPGIGPVTAKKLLKEFKSVTNILNTSQENLEKLIGKKSDIFKLGKENY